MTRPRHSRMLKLRIQHYEILNKQDQEKNNVIYKIKYPFIVSLIKNHPVSEFRQQTKDISGLHVNWTS